MNALAVSTTSGSTKLKVFMIRSGRAVLLGCVVALQTASTFIPAAAQTHAAPAAFDGVTMSVADAHAKALAGEIVLVDVRSQQEWMASGVPSSAFAITMHQQPLTFVDKLQEAVRGNMNKPLALICSTGNRTGSLQADLQTFGFKNVINVSEGTEGSTYGPGWKAAGLPFRRPAAPRQTLTSPAPPAQVSQAAPPPSSPPSQTAADRSAAATAKPLQLSKPTTVQTASAKQPRPEYSRPEYSRHDAERHSHGHHSRHHRKGCHD